MGSDSWVVGSGSGAWRDVGHIQSRFGDEGPPVTSGMIDLGVVKSK